MQICELAVGTLHIKWNGTLGLGIRAPNLRDTKLEPAFWQFDADPMRGSSHRIPDRLPFDLQEAGYIDRRGTSLYVDIQVDRAEDRWQLVRTHGIENPPDCAISSVSWPDMIFT